MFSILKFCITFCLSFILLSIPLQERPLFYHINQWTAPLTEEIFTSSKEILMRGLKEGKIIGEKMFNNTKPEKDSVKMRSSGLEKGEILDQNEYSQEETTHYSDEYTIEERNMLNQILKKSP